jgi:hypothetical protein
MVRRFGVAVLAVLILTVGVLAGEFKGKLKYLNIKKGTMTIIVGEKDVEFMIPLTAKVVDQEGKDVRGRLDALRGGEELTIVTEKDGDKDVVKEIRRKSQ